MMETNWQIGSLFGIPFYINSSWLYILIFVTLIKASEIEASGLTGANIWGSWLIGFLMALLLFISVLLHELGHSLVAKSQGIKVNSITLFLFGGVAALDRESETPSQALQVAIAGPVVSLMLFGLFLGLNNLSTTGKIISFITIDLATINLVLAIFNLIPGLPLDGGQILKAIVWQLTGDRFTGVLWAAASGKLLGWIGILFGLFLLLLTGTISAIWLSLISWFIFRNAYAYERLTTIQKSLLESVALEVMSQEFRVVNGQLTLQEFAYQYILSDSLKVMPYYAAAEGRYCGLIRPKDLNRIERSEWANKTLAAIAHPLTTIPSVTEKNTLVEVINKLETIDDKYLTVLSPAGAVAGIIDRGNIVEFVAKKHELDLSTSELKRVREEGTYPLGLDLATIAKTIQN
jgi:Zn-dependent protease